ncbi:MAG TPA: response regulator [Ferruginibacter sp.]|jgi:two-component system KDP operon response regulator KdpE|nr:response regulator [Ferruginibacter sp.]
MNNAEILVIDDEVQIRKLLEITLQSSGYKVVKANTAKEGLAAAATSTSDLIILDLGLPDENGQVVLKKLREWYVRPVIILSVKNNEDDIVSALDNGANDYLIKPFRTTELLARIRSVLRNSMVSQDIPAITYEDFEINFSTRTIKKDNVPVKFTTTQYELLTLFVKNEGKVLTHQYILGEIWGADYITQSQYLRVFVAQLRKKIEKNPNKPEYIITESGVGYRFIAKEV